MSDVPTYPYNPRTNLIRVESNNVLLHKDGTFLSRPYRVAFIIKNSDTGNSVRFDYYNWLEKTVCE